MNPFASLSFAAGAKLCIALIAAFALALLLHDRNRWKHLASDRQAQLVQVQAAFERTVTDYRSAAAQARADDAANKIRVEAEQVAINRQTERDYETRIADARARYNRVRAQLGAEADSGARGAAPMPDLPGAPGSATEAAVKNGLPDPDALIATEQAIQLDELIRWVRAQSVVDPNSAFAARTGKSD